MLKPVEKTTGFFVLCGFLVALDLSAVPLYGDEWSITSSASNFARPRTSKSAQNKKQEQRMRFFPFAVL